MKLKLISILPQQAHHHRIKEPMLGLPIIAALTPENVDVEIEDIIIDEDFTVDTSADMIGITTMTFTSIFAYKVAQKYKEAGKTVVMGGIHVSVYPEEALNYCDTVVIGEAELVWKSVINDFADGKLKPTYKASTQCSMDDVPNARLDLLSPQYYSTRGVIHSSRGCPYDCRFCTSKKFWGTSYRIRSVDKTIKEIEDMISKGICSNYLFFTDENLAFNKKYAKTLAKELKKLNIKWGAQCNLKTADDQELLELFASSGCVIMYTGIESITTENLIAMKKTMNSTNKYEEQIKKIKDVGILTATGMIIGLDEDDEAAIDRTEEFLIKNDIDFPKVSLLTPFPGTVLFDEMDKEGRLLTKDWSKYCFTNVIIKPKLMTPEVLQRKYDSLMENMLPRHKKGIQDFIMKISY